ncbi:MAG: hypothetical protein FVQ79_11300 [Planctomycetes bacterium]|nr:hypothetical protein [Planctomycetota bacterium]
MKKLILCISVMVAVCGCDQSQKLPQKPSIEGIKFTDLIPSTAEKLPAAIRLKMLTFELPRENLLQMSLAFKALSKENIKFVNRKAFDRNAFVAGIGSQEIWSLTGDKLKAAKAKKISTNNITIRNRDGDEIPVKEVFDNVSLIYTDASSQVIQHDLFSGTVSWRIKAGPAAQRKGAAIIKIEALSRSQKPSILSKATGNEEFGLTVFRSLSMMLKMEEGQFLILAPQAALAKVKTETPATINLAELFFFSRGDFYTRKPVTGSEKPDNGQYDFQKDIVLARIYMLICTEVQN